MVVRLIRQDECEMASALFHLCHPNSGQNRDAYWFMGHPTLVLVMESTIVGSTSFTLMPTTGGYIAYGFDTAVHPGHRGRGFASLLFEARIELLRKLGVSKLVGFVAKGNDPMHHLHSKYGFRAKETVQDAFPDGPGIFMEMTID